MRETHSKRLRLQDWLSQCWVISRSRRIDPAQMSWLMGPFGECDVIGDHYVHRLVRDEKLVIDQQTRDAGLLQSFDELKLAADDRRRLRPEIAAFYEHTADFEMEAWSQWNPCFRPVGGLISRLYSRRLQQLNLPLDSLETARGMRCEVLRLCEPDTSRVRYTIWHRILRSTGRVIYSGIYSAAQTPDGQTCVKVVFPLPNGNATVLLSVRVGRDGELILESSGERFGCPGFYFLLRDRRDQLRAQYIRSFRERITVYVDDEQTLRADHLLTLWGCRVLHLHYKMSPKQPPKP